MSLIVGRSFCEVTVSRNVSTAAPLFASVTVTVIVAVPNALASGVTVTVRFAPLPPNTMFALGTRAVFDELPLTTRSAAAVSMSPTVNANAPVVPSSAIVWSAMSLIVGRSFCEVTVSRNVSTAEPLFASVTVTVIVAVPNAFASGVTVTVRFAPLPPNTMFALGTRAVFDELPVTTRSAAAVSMSPTVNANAPVVPSSAIVWSAMSLIVGRSFCDVTVSRNVSTADRCSRPSP